MHDHSADWIGIIACGGESRRMGSDKGLIDYHGSPQCVHVAEMIRPFCSRVCLCLNPLQKSYGRFGIEAMVDEPPYSGIGPMAGLLTAFKRFPQQGLLFIGCDYPYLSVDSINEFASSVADKPMAAAFFDQDSSVYIPVLGFYSKDCGPLLKQQFSTGNFSLQFFLRAINARKFIPGDLNSLKSVDDVHGSERARQEISSGVNSMRSHLVAVQQMQVRKITSATINATTDTIAIEEPLEIRVTYSNDTGRLTKNVAVTMRTPGHDEELATGFLFTEAVLPGLDVIDKVQSKSVGNVITVLLKPNVIPNLSQVARNFYSSSSCGICGKASIEAISVSLPTRLTNPAFEITDLLLYSLPAILREKQRLFGETGGIHACGLFDSEGKLLLLREDVGRHNALDKLIGACYLEKKLPLKNRILLLSGRASFELVQKAAVAGIELICAIGAPSSMAVEMARENDITLIGFLKADRMNIYSGHERVRCLTHKTT